MTVTPTEVLTKRLYSSAAIGLCLAFFGISLMSLREIRKLVSPLRVVGARAAVGWASALRWVDAVRAGRLFPAVRAVPPEYSRRQAAERIATTLAAYAPPQLTLELAAAAFVGAHSQ
jgi:hypothetical protein